MLLAALCLLCPAADQAVADPSPIGLAQVRAVRVTQPVVIDGLLDDPIWRTACRVWDFHQRDPIEGAQPSESTVVLLAYDDAAFYVGARMYDSHPESIVARLGRRDAETNSDLFGVFIDPYYDRRSGFYFGLDAAGTLLDGTLFNDDWDDNSWDGVWEGRVRIDSLGWTAEMRIPYSQLRFHRAGRYTWGIDFRRDIARRHERDFLVYTPKNGSGFVSRFVDLVGIEHIAPPARLEVLGYTRGRAEFAPHTAGDPFNTGSSFSPDAGLDAKIGIGSNLTLNASVNPDFGQVEVDPAVVNLSDVETFFEEKRPFFIEGSSIFNYGHGGARNYWGFNWAEPQFLYSRRIGRAPQGSTPAADYTSVPTGAHILGALKLTGKAAGSWNVGAVSAVTSRVMADLDTAGVLFRSEVEPLAYYGVLRAQKEFPAGRQGLGFMSTLSARHFGDDRLRDEISSGALATGVDGWTFLDKSKTWIVAGWAGMSQVRGDAARITALQQNSRHYFQRPDAIHLHVDSTATSLTGWAARVYLNKQKGDWFSNSAIGVVAPQFDVNDLGFLWRAGVLNAHIGGGHDWNQPGKVFRFAELGGALFRNWDWDGDVNWTGLFHFGSVQLLNYYLLEWGFTYNPRTVSDRRTRGGPLSANPPGYEIYFNAQTDSRKAWVLGFFTGTYQAESDRNWYAAANIQLRPAPSVSFSVGPQLSGERTPAQYVGTFADSLATATYGDRYVFGHLRQTQLSAGIRLNWTYSPHLSFQLYAQPLISANAYSGFQELARPRTFDFTRYGRDNGSTISSADSTYTVDPDGPGGPAAPFQFTNPTFNFASLRGNAVLRWEYLPGSTIFLVWTQNRSDTEDTGDFRFAHSLDRMLSSQADNIFLVKVTYWWNP